MPSPSLPVGKVVAFLDCHGHYENEFRTTEEHYFQNIGIRVNHSQLGNVPTGPARLKYCGTLKWVSCGKGALTYCTNFPVVEHDDSLMSIQLDLPPLIVIPP